MRAIFVATDEAISGDDTPTPAEGPENLVEISKSLVEKLKSLVEKLKSLVEISSHPGMLLKENA